MFFEGPPGKKEKYFFVLQEMFTGV